MNTVPPETRPIGYWLKHLHRLAETHFAATLPDGLTRRHWQCLHTLADQPGTNAEIAARLSHFDDDPGPTVPEILADLRQRGWTGETDSVLSLTEDGVRAQERAARSTDEVRRRLMDGLSTADYVSTVRNLARMAANLSGEPSGPAPLGPVTARIRVADLDAAVPFYTGLTGEPAHRFAFGGARMATVGPFLLWCADDASARRLAAVAATITSPDLDSTVDGLRSAGAEIIAAPAATPNGRRCVARHPDGAVVEYVGA